MLGLIAQSFLWLQLFTAHEWRCGGRSYLLEASSLEFDQNKKQAYAIPAMYVSMYLPMYVSMPKHHSSFGHSIKCSLANETMRGQFIGNNLSYVKNVNARSLLQSFFA